MVTFVQLCSSLMTSLQNTYIRSNVKDQKTPSDYRNVPTRWSPLYQIMLAYIFQQMNSTYQYKGYP